MAYKIRHYEITVVKVDEKYNFNEVRRIFIPKEEKEEFEYLDDILEKYEEQRQRIQELEQILDNFNNDLNAIKNKGYD